MTCWTAGYLCFGLTSNLHKGADHGRVVAVIAPFWPTCTVGALTPAVVERPRFQRCLLGPGCGEPHTHRDLG